MKGTLLVAGATSDAGKSVLTAGLCRWLARKGVGVAPFKAQNMSNNSCVTPAGAEIGRAQVMQAEAARVEPTADMNPILLKPGSDRRSQVVVRGRAIGEIDAMHFAQGDRLPVARADDPRGDGPAEHGVLDRDALRNLARESLDRLRARYDVVICEGAGSPAEINLRAGDIANMGLARAADIPAIVVGDIDRGGVFASLYGTLALLDAADQSLVSGFVVNKFRGAEKLLRPGLDALQELTGRHVLGVIPWQEGVWLDAEDSLASSSLLGWRGRKPYGREILRVAVVRLPRISNFTDVDALACEPGVVVRFVDSPAEVLDADLVVLPGTRATVNDLGWMRSRGLDEALLVRNRPILGICGGYQMLATTIDDAVESGRGLVDGLGLLPVSVRFARSKALGRPVGEAYGCRVAAYEIHHGMTSVEGEAEPFLDGCRKGQVWGTTWHGALENDGFRRAFLRRVAEAAGREFEPAPDVSFSGLREAGLDALADAVERHLDTSFLERLITDGAPGDLPIVRAGHLLC